MVRQSIVVAVIVPAVVFHLGCGPDASTSQPGERSGTEVPGIRSTKGSAAYKQGIAAQEKLDFKKAVQLFSTAINQDAENADAFFRRGACLAMQHRDDEALRDLNQAIKLNPDFAEAYAKRGTILCDREQNDEGQADLEKAVALNPAQTDAQYLLGLVLLAIRDDAAAALPHLDRAAELEPKNGAVYSARALVHKQLGNATQAAQDESRAKKLQGAPRR